MTDTTREPRTAAGRQLLASMPPALDPTSLLDEVDEYLHRIVIFAHGDHPGGPMEESATLLRARIAPTEPQR